MHIEGFPFTATDWSNVEPVEHKTGPQGRGSAFWRTLEFGSVRVRMIDYTPGYTADHWCTKGHVVLCLQGTLTTELADGRTVTLTAGMSYQVADNAEPHRSRTDTGARLFIVD